MSPKIKMSLSPHLHPLFQIICYKYPLFLPGTGCVDKRTGLCYSDFNVTATGFNVCGSPLGEEGPRYDTKGSFINDVTHNLTQIRPPITPSSVIKNCNSTHPFLINLDLWRNLWMSPLQNLYILFHVFETLSS